MVRVRSRKELGRLVAKSLAGIWRHNPPALELSAEELSEIAPLLLGSGAGALGWRLVHHSQLRTSPSVQQFQQFRRQQFLQDAVHELAIKQAVTLLCSAGIEPILVKGWVIARLYPEKGLRHCGDIDLCVRTEQYDAAEAILQSPEGRSIPIPVDLHRGFTTLGDGSWDELEARSELVKLDELGVRVLGAEDHLRILCLHLLRHGAWRPLWFCDIALLLESRPANFDWERCQGNDRRRADWIACTLGLAHQLLGARIEDTPIAERARNLPRWLVPAVLRRWDMCFSPAYREMAVSSLLSCLRDPSILIEDIYFRWDNPIRATVELRGSFNELPRWPYQLLAVLSRTPEIPRQSVKLIRRQLTTLRQRGEAISLRA